MTNGRVVGIFYILSLMAALISSADAARTLETNKVNSYSVAALEKIQCN